MSAFSNSTRSLERDRFRPSILIASFAAVVLVLWAIWFFRGQITLYAIGNTVNIDSSGLVEADIPNQSLIKVKPGQFAWLRINGEVGEDLGLGSMLVLRVRPAAAEGASGRVELLLIDERFYPAIANEQLTGRVEIEIEQLSPAQLVLRSSGQFGAAPSISTSPQQNPQGR